MCMIHENNKFSKRSNDNVSKFQVILQKNCADLKIKTVPAWALESLFLLLQETKALTLAVSKNCVG